jgi:hypothetical protein
VNRIRKALPRRLVRITQRAERVLLNPNLFDHESQQLAGEVAQVVADLADARATILRLERQLLELTPYRVAVVDLLTRFPERSTHVAAD